MKLRLTQAASELKSRLLALDMGSLSDCPVYGKYLANYIREYDAVIVRYVHILERALRHRDPTTTTLLDFGAGTGILSFLAALAGVGRVVSLDINPEMSRAIGQTAAALGITLHGCLTGSYENITQVTDERFDVIINYDVLEHLYSPPAAFAALRGVLNPGGGILMASGANWLNPVILFINTRRQLLWERHGTPNMTARREARRQIITAACPHLSAMELDYITARTRGLRREDILAALERYARTGQAPKPPLWTDTCDPETGNWGEHSVNMFALARRLRELFAVVRLEPGLYPEVKQSFNEYNNSADDRLVSRLYPALRYAAVNLAPQWNRLVRLLPGAAAFVVAPYYIVWAKDPRKEQP